MTMNIFVSVVSFCTLWKLLHKQDRLHDYEYFCFCGIFLYLVGDTEQRREITFTHCGLFNYFMGINNRMSTLISCFTWYP